MKRVKMSSIPKKCAKTKPSCGGFKKTEVRLKVGGCIKYPCRCKIKMAFSTEISRCVVCLFSQMHFNKLCNAATENLRFMPFCA